MYFKRRALFSLQVAFLKSPSQVTKIYFPSTKLIYLKYNFDTFKNIENFTYQKADAESSLKACFHEWPSYRDEFHRVGWVSSRDEFQLGTSFIPEWVSSHDSGDGNGFILVSTTWMKKFITWWKIAENSCKLDSFLRPGMEFRRKGILPRTKVIPLSHVNAA